MPHNGNGTGPSMGLIEKYFGPSARMKKRKGDINLPSREEKERELSTTSGKIREGYKIFKGLSERK